MEALTLRNPRLPKCALSEKNPLVNGVGIFCSGTASDSIGTNRITHYDIDSGTKF